MERQTIESVDERLVNVTRFVLALSAFIIIYVDPSEPDRLVNITYTTLALYTVYSAVIYFLCLRYPSRFRSIPLYWIDVAWYVIFISLSSGTNSLFFFFFFFAILVASFRSGSGRVEGHYCVCGPLCDDRIPHDSYSNRTKSVCFEICLPGEHRLPDGLLGWF